MKPLFIPLKTEFFEAFANGTKDTEYRRYGPRWNERTCAIGREVVLSHGYGKKRRLSAVVVAHEAVYAAFLPVDVLSAWVKCYGEPKGVASCIRVVLMGPNVKCPS